LIAELAPRTIEVAHTIDQSIASGTVPLIAIQSWFFAQHQAKRHHFNQSVMLHSNQGLREDALRAVFEKIQAHHDALRMRYTTDGDGIIQHNNDLDHPLHFETIELREQEDAISTLETHARELQASINLDTGPLMKAVLYRLADGDRLLIIIHHLVVDGVSWRILLEDLRVGYEQYISGKAIEFPQKTHSFKIWAERIQPYSNSEALVHERDYWNSVESTRIEPLPQDYKRAKEGQGRRFRDKAQMDITASHTDTEALLKGVNHAYNTEINDILLTALARAMKQWHGRDRTLITLEGHGRQEIIDGVDISRTVGWFTGMYPVILELPDSEDIGYQIKYIKESLRRIPNKGIGYGILKYITAPAHKKEIKYTLSPQISFNYLGQFDEDMGTGLFEIAKESMGDAIAADTEITHDIDISGIVIRGQLKLSVSYNKKRYRSKTIGGIMADYMEQLKAIITHCQERQTNELTPSDLTYSDFTLDEFEGIFEDA